MVLITTLQAYYYNFSNDRIISDVLSHFALSIRVVTSFLFIGFLPPVSICGRPLTDIKDPFWGCFYAESYRDKSITANEFITSPDACLLRLCPDANYCWMEILNEKPFPWRFFLLQFQARRAFVLGWITKWSMMTHEANGKEKNF